jgi:energy-coupling factor transport system ATP-binding protein
VQLGRLAGWDPLPLTVRDARRQARALSSLSAPEPTPGREAEPVLEARGVTVVHGTQVAVRDVDLTLAEGSVTVLMGRNGSGKSSLIWALQGSGKRRSGTLDVRGDDPATLAPAQRRTHVGLVPQTAADLLYLETVAEECVAADAGADAPGGTCRGLLDRLAPGIEAASHPRDLSEGQRLALALSIVLTARPPVVLLDEPTRGLDYAGKAELARIVADLAADGRAVLLATHDVEFAAHVADEVVVMAEGEVVSSGSPQHVLAESPSFAPQVTKVLGAPWLVVEEVAAALARAVRE